MIFNDSLCHYGVKGMKWGVRKDKSLDTWFDDDRELLEIYLMDIDEKK